MGDNDNDKGDGDVHFEIYREPRFMILNTMMMMTEDDVDGDDN